MEVGTVALSELNSHKRARDEEEDDEGVDDQAATFGVPGNSSIHITIISRLDRARTIVSLTIDVKRPIIT